MDSASKVQMFQVMWPAIAIVGVSAMAAWVLTTWMRIRHGYPLETSWGKPLHPTGTGETAERVKLLTQENAQLRAELDVAPLDSTLELVAALRRHAESM